MATSPYFAAPPAIAGQTAKHQHNVVAATEELIAAPSRSQQKRGRRRRVVQPMVSVGAGAGSPNTNAKSANPGTTAAWTSAQDQILVAAMQEHGARWPLIYRKYGPGGTRELPAVPALAHLAIRALRLVEAGSAPASVRDMTRDPGFWPRRL